MHCVRNRIVVVTFYDIGIISFSKFIVSKRLFYTNIRKPRLSV
nr:MAG TPA: hypothetical protein [Bacteriophage sp.]